MQISFSQPFAEQLEFFRKKLNLPTQAYDDITGAAHDHAFVVAGAMQADLLADLRGAIDKAIIQGKGLAAFRKDFKEIVAKSGWAHTGTAAWRSKVIFQTNLRTSHAAGRWAQLTKPSSVKARPFWRYVHSDYVLDPRPLHQAWDGLILPWDDPWWSTHFPPNGWGCQCTIQAIATDELASYGKTQADNPPSDAFDTRGIDDGWDYAPGSSASSLLDALTPSEVNQLSLASALYKPASDSLPAPRAFDPDRLLPENTTGEQAAKAFLAEFGATLEQPVVFTDATGQPLTISASLFTDAKGRSKGAKRERSAYMRLLADTLKDPDEIWDRFELYQGKKLTLRRRYVANFIVEETRKPGIAVFERSKEGWFGITTYQAGPQQGLSLEDYIQTIRIGHRAYRRNEKGQSND